jgi:hypothetical protein
MHLTRPFDPLAPGESDNFAFDFTPDLGTIAIASTSWTCALKPYQTFPDPAPQAHVLATYPPQSIIGTDEGLVAFPADVATVLAGAFSVARIGGFTAAQAGATYLLTASVVTADGRTLSLSADLPIQA